MALQVPEAGITGLILAGGTGLRLGGVRKGALRLRNVTLLERVIAALRPKCTTMLLSVGINDVTRHREAIALPDSPDGVTGPAAGLQAGARWCARNRPGALMVSASVDTPFLPADFVARALALLDTGCGCVVAAYDGRDYPTNALWRADWLLAHLDAIPPAPRGPRLRDVQAALGGVRLDYSDIAPANPFAGINRLTDLLALEARLKAGDQ